MLSSSARAAERPRLRIRTLIAVLCAFVVQFSLADQDQVEDFCRRFGHQTAVIDRRLYIDGGLLNWNPISQYPANYSNRELVFEDLDVTASSGMPQLNTSLFKNSSVPSVSGGALWADNVNKRLYLFGGEYYQEPPPVSFTLWSYDALNNIWQSLGSPAQASGIQRVSFGAGVAVSERGEAYYYGGWLSNTSVAQWSGPPVATGGLVRYQMDANAWTNSTGPDGARRAEGALVYIPASDGGMLVYLGGVTDPYGNGTVAGQPMAQVFVYDVLSSKWYTQNVTGTIPGMRRRFCVGATWAADQSSYNIYLYGGANITVGAGYDDVYVLSIPTFTWIKLWPTDGNVTGSSPHHSMTCNVISGAQMLIMGGTFPLTQDCDAPQQWGTHNLDMGEQTAKKQPWQLFLPNLTTYAVPDPVIAVVGGGPGGGATRTAPAQGFDNPDLSVLMTRRASVAARTPTRAIPNATGSSGSGGSAPLGTGAIAGVAVGGAALFVLLLVGCCCFVRRRHRHGRYEPQFTAIAAAPHSPPSGGPWSPHRAPADPSHAPTSPHHHQGPASPWRTTRTSRVHELPAGSIWQGQEGATYEMSPSPSSPPYRHYSQDEQHQQQLQKQPGVKVDEQGRVWVAQDVLLPGLGSSPASSPGSPQPSFARRVGGTRYNSPGVAAARSPAPQELSSDPRRSDEIISEVGGSGGGGGMGGGENDWPFHDAGRERQQPAKHQTYYHP